MSLSLFSMGAFAKGTEVAINEENFPDEKFRSIVTKRYNLDKSSALSNDEISQVTMMEVSDNGIPDLKGIEHFTDLTYLDCSSNSLINLEICKNMKWESLGCNNNKLTDLDVSKNTALEQVHCSGNSHIVYQTENLDYSKSPGNFDVTKVFNVVGGTFDANSNTFSFDANVTEATYDYAIGNGKTANFRLVYEKHRHKFGK